MIAQKRPGVGDKLHVLKCKHCTEYVLFEYRAAHALECRSKRNRAKLANMNLEKSGQAMYAVAATRLRKGQWSTPTIDHVHANNPAHARAQFMAGEKPSETYIIETGLAIGWFEAKDGLITG